MKLFVCRKYDLKGSTVDREASDKERGKDLPTLKDNDFLKDGGRIYIGEEAKEKLMETLNADIGVSVLSPFFGCTLLVCNSAMRHFFHAVVLSHQIIYL